MRAGTSQIARPLNSIVRQYAAGLSSMDKFLTLISMCILLASVETLQGIIRARFIVPITGKKKALTVSAISGSTFALLICYVMVPRLGLYDSKDLLLVGIMLAAFMALFDIFIGRVVMKLRWPKILKDFNPTSGNYISVALILLIIYPYLVMKL